MSKRPKSVMGIDAPGPRPTPTAIWLVLRYLGLPLLAALLIFDIFVWALADAIWGICIGVWCWL